MHVIGLILFCAMIWGWVANIYKLVTFVGAFTILEAVRILGIFVPPVGVVVGYIN